MYRKNSFKSVVASLRILFNPTKTINLYRDIGDTYRWIVCTNYVYGNNWTKEVFDGRVKILIRDARTPNVGVAWARDYGQYHQGRLLWSRRDFILHGWKEHYFST